MSKICCLTGHREIRKANSLKLIESLESTLTTLIENEDVTDFRAGGAKGFDTIAAVTVLKFKQKYPHIKLHLILPYKNQSAGYTEHEKQLYDFVLKSADSVHYTAQNYYDGVLLARDRELVNGADFCVAYLEVLSGGTYYTVNYARKNKVKVFNVYKV
jgi:uncharacterized phage-like protein YoqJ